MCAASHGAGRRWNGAAGFVARSSHPRRSTATWAGGTTYRGGDDGRGAMSANASVLLDEDRLWGELRATIDMFDDELASRPGYFAEGWSAKDALAHVGTWLAEAGAAL